MIIHRPRRLPPGLRPPVGSQINWGHQLAKGLAGCWIFHDAGSMAPINLVDQSVGSLGSTSPTWTQTNKGYALSFDGTNNSGSLGSSAATADLASGPMTAIIWANISSSSNYGALFGRNDSNTVGAGWFIRLDPNGVDTIVFNKEYTSINVTAKASTSVTYNTEQMYAVTFDGSTNASSVTIYIDAIPSTITSSANGSGSSGSDASQPLVLGSYSGFGAKTKSVISQAMCYRRMLTAGEIQALYIDRYAFMAQDRQRLWMVPAAGGGTTYNDTISFGSTMGYTLANNAILANTITFASTMGLSDAAIASIAAAVTMAISPAYSNDSIAQFASSVNMGVITAVQAQSIANYVSSIILTQRSGIQASYPGGAIARLRMLLGLGL